MKENLTELKDKCLLNSPVFIISSPRSGSTLLRLILNSHSEISIPHEFPLIELVINTFGEKTFLTGIEAELFVDKLNFIEKFKDWKIDQNELKKHIRSYDKLRKSELIQLIYLQYNSSTKIWGDKNIHTISYIRIIVELFPKAKFIHIIRDGRDVAVSLNKVKWLFYKFPFKKRQYLNNIKGQSMTWVSALESISNNSDVLNKTNLLEIKYEDLIFDSKKILNTICMYLNVEFEDEMLDYYKNDTSIPQNRINTTHQNTKKAIDRNNSNKFLKGLSKNEIALFEYYASDYLKKYDYALFSKPLPFVILVINSIKYTLSYYSMFAAYKIKHFLFK